MARVMQLDGLGSAGHLAEIRRKLNAADRGSPQLMGVLDPFTSRPWIVVAGVVIGAWLAGSATGKRLLSSKRR